MFLYVAQVLHNTTVQIFVRLPEQGASNDSGLVVKRYPVLSITLEPWEIRPKLLYSNTYVVSQWLSTYPETDDLESVEWPFYVKFCFQASMSTALSRGLHRPVRENKQRRYAILSQCVKRRPWTPVSDNITFMQTFTWFPGEEELNDIVGVLILHSHDSLERRWTTCGCYNSTDQVRHMHVSIVYGSLILSVMCVISVVSLMGVGFSNYGNGQ